MQQPAGRNTWEVLKSSCHQEEFKAYGKGSRTMHLWSEKG